MCTLTCSGGTLNTTSRFLFLSVLATAFLLVTYTISSVQAAEGQPYVLEGTQVWPVPDQISGREYEVFVSLPPKYNEQAKRRYPVLYITDADYGFPLIRSITKRINLDGPVTGDFILVGLSYAKGDDGMTSRRRDYTPAPRNEANAAAALSGGGPAYQKYLRNAVLPFVDGKFRTDPSQRLFMGHSYGALLGTQILLSEPSLFNSYILGSPSYWYDDHIMFDLEKEYAKSNRDLSANVFMYMGGYETLKSGDARYNRSKDMVKDMAAFEERLKSRNYPNLHVQSVTLPNENHLTVFPAGFTKGIIEMLPAKR
ncbi:alpha/beta hydrolase-fold protein [Phyllobacterium sp. YR531]|uniref:alpha/beta hydrolase n=1 Tax=Phyllobacterium sp. YR531 TaxID=1144343 RepID=UPI00026F497B|nr:alpha/beta hydrolase-fold protein [Phyllobacterium sp. YR531]EJN04389.1 putative hydrolase of alpha/beta superfamily [Phyllobacterium sp. YR531]